MICAFAPDLVCPCGQGTNYYLGLHESAEAAGLAYDQKARSLGWFHKVNFPVPFIQMGHHSGAHVHGSGAQLGLDGHDADL